MAFAAFDVLELDGHGALAEPWTARRKRLEDLLEAPPLGVCLVPVTDDAAALWDTWVGIGGEGIVLKERTSVYRPGVRSPAWLKLKPKLTLDGVVTGGSAERVRWGDWGEAVMLELRYVHPRTGADVEIRQAVRVPRDLPFDLRTGARLELVCWGVMPSGLLEAAETLAAERGCLHAFLETFSFQAPLFYQKLGYEVFGEADDWPVGHTHYFLRKRLESKS